MDMEIVKTVIITLLTSGALFGFIQFLIKKKKKKNGRYKEVLDGITKLSEKIDTVNNELQEEKAVAARVRILGFMNSLLENHKPTKDAFDQTMSDITRYERFCQEHPTFKNNQTASTVAYLEKNYQERLDKHDFL